MGANLEPTKRSYPERSFPSLPASDYRSVVMTVQDRIRPVHVEVSR